MNRSPIYPEVLIEENTDRFSIKTMIRKKHSDGLYYKWNVVVEYSERCDYAITSLIKDCYYAMILGKVSLDLVDRNGDPIFELDDDQTPEEERLMKMMKL